MNNKIILIGSLPPPHHGSNTYFRELLHSKLLNDFDVIHLDTSDHRGLSNLNSLDIRNVYLAIKNLVELFLILIKHNPSVVYIPHTVHMLPFIRDGLFIVISHVFSKAKIITHLHGGTYFRDVFYNKSTKIGKRFIKYCLSKVDYSIVIGNSMKDVYKNLVKNIVIIYNGINTDNYYNISNNENITIGYVGNYSNSKGTFDFVKSLKNICKKNNILIKLCGEWSLNEKTLKKEIYKFIYNNDFRNKIVFYNKLTGDELTNFYASCDIFVFPSYNEGLPMVILEAMASNCTVITSRGVGSIDEIIIDNQNGLLINPGDISGIENAILRLIDDQRLRYRLSKNAHVAVRQKYTINKNVNEIKKLLVLSTNS